MQERRHSMLGGFLSPLVNPWDGGGRRTRVLGDRTIPWKLPLTQAPAPQISEVDFAKAKFSESAPKIARCSLYPAMPSKRFLLSFCYFLAFILYAKWAMSISGGTDGEHTLDDWRLAIHPGGLGSQKEDNTLIRLGLGSISSISSRKSRLTLLLILCSPYSSRCDLWLAPSLLSISFGYIRTKGAFRPGYFFHGFSK